MIRVLAFLALAAPAMAQTPMSGAEFEAFTQGKTLYFSQNGEYYGAEQYRPDNKVYWQYPDGQCVEGRWYEQAGVLCFEYTFEQLPQCWVMWLDGDRALAKRADIVNDLPIEMTRKDDLPLPCAGPDLGV